MLPHSSPLPLNRVPRLEGACFQKFSFLFSFYNYFFKNQIKIFIHQFKTDLFLFKANYWWRICIWSYVKWFFFCSQSNFKTIELHCLFLRGLFCLALLWTICILSEMFIRVSLHSSPLLLNRLGGACLQNFSFLFNSILFFAIIFYKQKI